MSWRTPYYSGKPPQFKNLYFDLYGKDADVVNAYQYSNVGMLFVIEPR